MSKDNNTEHLAMDKTGVYVFHRRANLDFPEDNSDDSTSGAVSDFGDDETQAPETETNVEVNTTINTEPMDDDTIPIQTDDAVDTTVQHLQDTFDSNMNDTVDEEPSVSAKTTKEEANVSTKVVKEDGDLCTESKDEELKDDVQENVEETIVTSTKTKAGEDAATQTTPDRKRQKTALLVDNITIGPPSALGRNPAARFTYILAGNDGTDGRPGTCSNQSLMRDQNRNPLPSVIAPPQYNTVHFTSSTNYKCLHCKYRGNFCHNKHYGRYCILMTVRYRKEVGLKNFNEEKTKEEFICAYAYCFEFEHFLQRTCIPAKLKTDVPDCMKMSSLPLALNLNNWYIVTNSFEGAISRG